MEEKKSDVGVGASEPSTMVPEQVRAPEVVAVTTEGAPSATAHTTSSTTKSSFKVYAVAGAAVLLIVAGLLFLLEKQGRISTGIFSSMIAQMEKSKPVALVNGVEISRADFDNNVKQIGMGLSQQGTDITNPEVQASMRTQAIDTLVNTELLRQLALDAGFVADESAVQDRYNEIEASVGGAETLAVRMAEAGVTEVALRRDITNEQLIEQLIEDKVDLTTIEVSDEEVTSFYDQVGGEAAGLPPLDTIRDDVVARLRFDKEQVLVNEYILEIRADADIEILI